MLSSFFRSFNQASIMAPIRESAKSVAASFAHEGMKQFFIRWGDNVYNEGIKISDRKELEAYAAAKKKEVEALQRQAAIQQMFKNVDIPNWTRIFQ